jgi:hypothetical protein
MNEKIYIHEVIDITGHGRARYLHHITANWAPLARRERNQVCFGVWGVVGTTKRFPEVINLWEEDGFRGLAKSYRHEFNHNDLQNPTLVKWWAEAAKTRSGGLDRLMLPAPWTRTIDELLRDGVKGEVFAHETVRLHPGCAREFLAHSEQAAEAHARFGWVLVAALRTALINDTEALLIWCIPTYESWAEYELAQESDPKVVAWRNATDPMVEYRHRFLAKEAPLSPMRLGRQPDYSDRTDGWED